MQLLIQTHAADFATWKAGFDAQGEAIASSGLTTLQIWKGEAGAVLVLFEVANRARAADWLARQSALGQGLIGQFLETA